MAKYSDLLRSGFKVRDMATKSMEWLRGLFTAARGGGRGKPPDTEFRDLETSSTPEIGSMYFFTYDALHKNTLPYWDQYPLIFCLENNLSLKNGPGFMGINLHYLPPSERAALMDVLDTIKTNDKYDDTTKLKISYRFLKEYSLRFAGYEQCVKLYLYSHVYGSTFYYIKPSSWNMVIMMPLHKWRINPNPARAGTPPYP